MSKLMVRVLKMKGQAQFLGIDLQNISRIFVDTSATNKDVTQIY